MKAPRQLTPAFYGCYDWHSSVPGHWLLVRLARTFPDAPFAAEARSHRTAGLEAVKGEHYEGGHWLGRFAVYLATQRGLTP